MKHPHSAPVRYVVLLLSLSLACVSAYGQSARQLVSKSVNAEIAADQADHSRWIFYEVDKKPGSSVTQWVAQTSHGNVKRVMIRNGRSISKAAQQNAVNAFVKDSQALAAQKQSDRKDSQQAESLLRMLPNGFLWNIVKRDADFTILQFKPNPQFVPPTRQARVFAAMAGDLTIDNHHFRIVRLKGTLVHDVNFGWGILGSLKKGGWFQVERSQTEPGIWQITNTHVHIQGHALLFKTISEQEDDLKSHFSREPDDVTLQQAAQAVMEKPEHP